MESSLPELSDFLVLFFIIYSSISILIDDARRQASSSRFSRLNSGAYTSQGLENP